MEELNIPEELLSRWKKLLQNELEEFLEALKRPLTPSIRVNTLKAPVDGCLSFLRERGMDIVPIPWCPWGYWLKNVEEESIGNWWEHFAGLIYVQEASSMIPVEVLQPQPGETVLDIAAAPGSKTTHAAQKMENTGVIVANDLSIRRLKALTNNLERLGIVNVIVTQMDGRRFGRITPNSFDKVIVDAPCSAEGTIRKSYKAIYNWHQWAYKKLAETQKALLISAIKACKPQGVIVYSTCTFAPEENEAVVSYMLHKYPVKVEEIALKGLNSSCGIEEWEGEIFHPDVKKCIRVYPHRNDVGGFFVAKLRKLEG